MLSAKYGLLDLTDDIEPYQQTLNDASPAERHDWARAVLAELKRQHGPSLRGITFAFHAGQAYSDDLSPLLTEAGAAYTSPVAGLPIHRKAERLGTGPDHQGRRMAGRASPARCGPTILFPRPPG